MVPQASEPGPSCWVSRGEQRSPSSTETKVLCLSGSFGDAWTCWEKCWWRIRGQRRPNAWLGALCRLVRAHRLGPVAHTYPFWKGALLQEEVQAGGLGQEVTSFACFFEHCPLPSDLPKVKEQILPKVQIAVGSTNCSSAPSLRPGVGSRGTTLLSGKGPGRSVSSSFTGLPSQELLFVPPDLWVPVTPGTLPTAPSHLSCLLLFLLSSSCSNSCKCKTGWVCCHFRGAGLGVP